MDDKFSFSDLLLLVEGFSVDFNSLIEEGGFDRFGSKCIDEDKIRKSDFNYDRLLVYIKILQQLYTFRPLPFLIMEKIILIFKI